VKKEKLFSEFEELGKRLGIKILKGKGNFAGGTCVVNNETVIVLNNMKPIQQRLNILANSFLEYNLDDIYMVPALRAYIEESRSLDL
tara:strand:- start:96 stop:356 length:261 start_codon:yes stop_codon:yes gene_type:complete